MEEVAALVVQEVLVQPVIDNRRLLCFACEVYPRVTESENGVHVVRDVGEALVLVVVRQEVQHDLPADAQSSSVHLLEVVAVVKAVVVRGHAQVTRDVLQNQFDQEEELSVEHLTVDHELNIVLLDHLFDPVRDVSLHSLVVDKVHFLSFLSRVVYVHLTDVLLDPSFVDEHVG